MPSVAIRNLSKSFGSFVAVDNVSIDIPDGSFVCLLGPSGCGKTTLLRLLAGLEPGSHGQVLVGGKNQSGIPAHKRGFGMVFQSLALFPHLTVAENVAYPLKIRGIDKTTRNLRVAELLNLVKLPEIQDRKIHQLSGGQRQRVAIARGLAIEPKLFLLDEPLSALDAKLRAHMQVELRVLQKKLNVTTIVVTHDQREAMSMADIVIVMDKGRVLQSGSPMEIYRNPVNSFVADFIGMSNLLPCSQIGKNQIDVLGAEITLEETDTISGDVVDSGILSVRPEDITISPFPKGNELQGTVVFIRDLGASVEILVQSGEFEILSACTPDNRPEIEIGRRVGLRLQTGRLSVMQS